VSRVAHVSAYYAPAWRYGGPPRSIHGLCRALCQHGVDVQVFTTDANGDEALPPEVTVAGEFEGVPVRYFPRSWPASPIGSGALSAGLRVALAPGPLRLSTSLGTGPSTSLGTGGPGLRGIDVVHIHGLWNRVVWAAAREARRAQVPYVISPRGMLQDAARAHHGWRKRAAFAVIERRVLEGASLLHATSEDEAATLDTLRLGPPIAFIPNGIDLGGSERTRSAGEVDSRGAGPFGPAVLFVGRLHPIKRLDLLIDAFVLLRQSHPDAQLTIAGPDEYGLREGLEARAGSAAPAMTWLGEVGTARRDELMRGAAALVLCSDSESFGMSVLEAMAAATPVVVTRTCGWAGLEQLGAGLLVDQRSDAIAAALARLLDAPAMAAQMGDRGRHLAETRYAWPRVAEAFADRYDQLCRSHASSS
jgi:glycosyltransferase involved in cell wall biosynthesis